MSLRISIIWNQLIVVTGSNGGALDDDDLQKLNELMEEIENMEDDNDDDVFELLEDFVHAHQTDQGYYIDMSPDEDDEDCSREIHSSNWFAFTVSDKDGNEVYCGDLRRFPIKDVSANLEAGIYVMLVTGSMYQSIKVYTDSGWSAPDLPYNVDLDEPFDPKKLYYISSFPTTLNNTGILDFLDYPVSPEVDLKYQGYDDFELPIYETDNEYTSGVYIVEVNKRGEGKVLRKFERSYD